MYLRLKNGTEILIKHLQESIRFRTMEQLLLISMEGNYSTLEILNLFTKDNISSITFIDDNENNKSFYQYKQIESLNIEYNNLDFNLNTVDLILTDREKEG